ncbi:hypothetical protein KA529_02215 [Candidatus Saccharibacteria bacterium]|nr:hypothetical protein [Candidatus Saccharibacteria bacterium]
MNVFEEQLGFEPSVIAIPKGDDRVKSYEVYRDMFGLDPPALGGENPDSAVIDGGITVISLKGADIPRFVDEGWADAGLTGIDSLEEYRLGLGNRPSLTRLDCPERSMGRFSLFAAAIEPDGFEAAMRSALKDRVVERALTSFPNFLWKLVQENDYPIVPVNIPIKGSVEAARGLFDRAGVKYGADVVVSGRSLERNEQKEVKRLSEIFPVVIKPTERRTPQVRKWPVERPVSRGHGSDRSVTEWR